MFKNFSMLDTDEAIRVVGGTNMEDAAREIGRMVGRLVGSLQKLFEQLKKPQVSASF